MSLQLLDEDWVFEPEREHKHGQYASSCRIVSLIDVSQWLELSFPEEPSTSQEDV